MLNNQVGLQQPLQDAPMTIRVTESRWTTSTTTATATRFRYVSEGITAVPAAVQTWYAGQQEEGCDRTACACCRVYYDCGQFGLAW